MPHSKITSVKIFLGKWTTFHTWSYQNQPLTGCNKNKPIHYMLQKENNIQGGTCGLDSFYKEQQSKRAGICSRPEHSTRTTTMDVTPVFITLPNTPYGKSTLTIPDRVMYTTQRILSSSNRIKTPIIFAIQNVWPFHKQTFYWAALSFICLALFLHVTKL